MAADSSAAPSPASTSATSVRSLVDFAVRNSILQNHVTNWTTLSKGDTSGTGFGGFVGYNFQWDDVTFGLEANYTRTSLSKSASDSMSRSFLDNSNAPAGHDYTYDATVTAKAAIHAHRFRDLPGARRLGRRQLHALWFRRASRWPAPTSTARRP